MRTILTSIVLIASLSTFTYAQKGKGSTRTYAAGTIAKCEQIIKGKSGDVYAGAPGVITLNSCPVHILKITVSKFTGRAKTDVKIFVDGVLHTTYNYPNGPQKPAMKELSISGMTGKKVQVKVYNRSVGNMFRYGVNMKGRVTELVTTPDRKGNIIGGTKKTIHMNSSCVNNTRITIKRKSQNARALVKIYEGYGINQFREITSERTTFELGDAQKVFNLSSSASYKIEIKNLAPAYNFRYEATAVGVH